MVDVAQLVERRIVIPVVEGSIPFVHPIFQKAPDENPAPFAFVPRVFLLRGVHVGRSPCAAFLHSWALRCHRLFRGAFHGAQWLASHE